jgi:hypothetical protein
MSLGTFIEVGGFLITFGVLIFHAGRTEGKFREIQNQSKFQGDGLGKKCRDMDSKQERRWKHSIANMIEELEPKEKSARIAKLLREDAWRD